MIAVVPCRQIVMLAQALGLEALAPPIDTGSFEEYMFHPLTAQTDPASIWLRTMVAEVAAGLAGNP